MILFCISVAVSLLTFMLFTVPRKTYSILMSVSRF